MGTPEFAVPSLQTLVSSNRNVVAVVTAPDKPRGRGQQVSATPVKEFALRHSIPVLQPDALNDPRFAADIASINPDLMVVVAFRILPKEVFSIPRLGTFNLHASLLPRYRGAAPINWAIINGERETGVTTFFLREKVDTGNIILQRTCPIGEDMNAGELHDLLSGIGSEAVLETVRLIETGNIHPVEQNDALASPAPKLFKDSCRIRWNQSADSIHNVVRGLSPHPAAWTMHQKTAIKIYRTRRVLDEVSGVPHGESAGAIIVAENRLFVTTADHVIEVLELQQEGKKRMSAGEFLRGYRFNASDVFQ